MQWGSLVKKVNKQLKVGLGMKEIAKVVKQTYILVKNFSD